MIRAGRHARPRSHQPTQLIFSNSARICVMIDGLTCVLSMGEEGVLQPITARAGEDGLQWEWHGAAKASADDTGQHHLE